MFQRARHQAPSSSSSAIAPATWALPPERASPLSAYLSNMHLSPRSRAASEPRDQAHPRPAPHISKRELLRSRSDSPMQDIVNPYLHPIFHDDEDVQVGWTCFERTEYDLAGTLPDELKRMPEVRVRTHTAAAALN